MQIENISPTLYGQQLAWQTIIKYSIDPTDNIKPVKSIEPNRFKEKIVIQVRKKAIVEAKKYWPGVIMQIDGFKFYQENVGAAVY